MDEDERVWRAETLLANLPSDAPAVRDAMDGNERVHQCTQCPPEVHDPSSRSAIEGGPLPYRNERGVRNRRRGGEGASNTEQPTRAARGARSGRRRGGRAAKLIAVVTGLTVLGSTAATIGMALVGATAAIGDEPALLPSREPASENPSGVTMDLVSPVDDAVMQSILDDVDEQAGAVTNGE